MGHPANPNPEDLEHMVEEEVPGDAKLRIPAARTLTSKPPKGVVGGAVRGAHRSDKIDKAIKK